MIEKKIEDIFNKYFTGDTLKNALNFADFLNENKMVYNGKHEVCYKDELACYINTPNDDEHTWGVWTVGDYNSEYEGFAIDERTKKIAWKNVVKCGNCDDCNRDPGKTEVIFMKKFFNVCNGTDSLAIRFVNPDAETLECVKKMVDMRKYFIDNRTA